jgi:hypothetical protein
MYFAYDLFSAKKFTYAIFSLPKIIIVSSAFIFFSYSLAWFIGKGIEYSIDKVCKFSYIELNDGDRALITKHGREDSKNIIRIFSYLLALIVNIILTYFIKILLHMA